MHTFKVYNSVFLVYSQILFNPYHCSILGRFYDPVKKPSTYQHPFRILPSPWPLRTMRLLSVSVDLPIGHFPMYSIRQYMAFCELASFTEHDVFKVYPCCKHVSVRHPFLFPSNYSTVWIYIIYSPANRQQGYFYFLTTVNNTTKPQVLKGVCFRQTQLGVRK